MNFVTIKLSPHDAIMLSTFHQLHSDSEHVNYFSLKNAMNNFFEQVVENMPEDGFDDASAEIHMNILLGRGPADNDETL